MPNVLIRDVPADDRTAERLRGRPDVPANERRAVLDAIADAHTERADQLSERPTP